MFPLMSSNHDRPVAQRCMMLHEQRLETLTHTYGVRRSRYCGIKMVLYHLDQSGTVDSAVIRRELK